MLDTFVTAILPYTVMVGIAVSAVASIALVVSTFMRTRHFDSDVIPRLAEIESSIKRNAARIDGQVDSAFDASGSVQARVVVSDLYEIAHDLQGRAGEVHRLLDQIESDARLAGDGGDHGRIVDLGKAVLKTESYLAAIVKKIELRKSELATAHSAHAIDEG